MLEIRQVPPTYPDIGVKIDLPALAYIGVDEGEIVGCGGVAWGMGRCWIWFNSFKTKPEYAIPVMRKTKELLAKAHQFGETSVFTPRDVRYETSQRLLSVLGFSFFAVENGVEVWNHVGL